MDTLPFLRAFLEGYLLPHEYAGCYGFVAFLCLVVTMGLLLAREEPAWAGHLLWSGILVLVFTFVPAAKWFGTYEVWARWGERAATARRDPGRVALSSDRPEHPGTGRVPRRSSPRVTARTARRVALAPGRWFLRAVDGS